MPSTLARTTLIAFFLSASSIALAQTQAQTNWPQPGNHADYGTVEVITLANPGHRNYCRVHAITPDTIVCGVGAARKPVLYHRDEVAAILDPVNHDATSQMLEHSLITGCEAGGVIMIVVIAAVIISPWASLAIAVTAITYAIYSAIHPHTTWHAEEVLYQRPNTPLTIHLRTH